MPLLRCEPPRHRELEKQPETLVGPNPEGPAAEPTFSPGRQVHLGWAGAAVGSLAYFPLK